MESKRYRLARKRNWAKCQLSAMVTNLVAMSEDEGLYEGEQVVCSVVGKTLATLVRKWGKVKR